jgi:hypothetical protein
MTPEDLAKSGTESGHQRALFCWASIMQRTTWPELRWMYAIPNGGGRSASQGNALKAEGVKGGVSDVCLPIARKGYYGFYIEMKKPGNDQVTPKIKPGVESDLQKEFGAFLATQGYLYRCCFTWEEARDSIEWYMS